MLFALKKIQRLQECLQGVIKPYRAHEFNFSIYSLFDIHKFSIGQAMVSVALIIPLGHSKSDLIFSFWSYPGFYLMQVSR